MVRDPQHSIVINTGYDIEAIMADSANLPNKPFEPPSVLGDTDWS